MSRILSQKNTWGSQGGPNPQRADLWVVDFSQAIYGMNEEISLGDMVHNLERIDGQVEAYYVSSVKMPTSKVKAEEIRRDSRPYMTPSFDEPLSEIGITFMLESPISASRSKIYKFLDTWRAFVRAGRGAMGGEKAIEQLSSNFRVEARFPVTITFLRGANRLNISNLSSLTCPSFGSLDQLDQQLAGLSEEEKQARLAAILSNDAGVSVEAYPVDNLLQKCAVFSIHNMWLSGFKATDLDYSKGNEIVKLEATFYADNIRDLTA